MTRQDASEGGRVSSFSAIAKVSRNLYIQLGLGLGNCSRPLRVCHLVSMLSRIIRTNGAAICADIQCLRAFSASAGTLEKPLPPRIVVPESDIEESFLKGSGPGGQKINKTSSAVQLKHLPTGIVVKNQETRSREQNRKNARRLLGERLEEMEKGPLSRTAIKAEKASKKKASAAKKSRRKYRKLEEGKSAATASEETHDEDSEDMSLNAVEIVPDEDVRGRSGNSDGGRRE